MEGKGEKKEKNPLEKLIINKGGRGLPLSSDQPRTQRLFMTTSDPNGNPGGNPGGPRRGPRGGLSPPSIESKKWELPGGGGGGVPDITLNMNSSKKNNRRISLVSTLVPAMTRVTASLTVLSMRFLM